MPAPSKKCIVCLALLILVLPGCYGKRIYDIETQLYQQRHDIRRLRDSLDYVSRAVARLDTTVGAESAPIRTERAMLETRMDELQTRLEILEAQVDENRYKIGQMSIQRQLLPAGMDTAAAPLDTSMARASVATHIYETAYLDFTKGDIESAVEGFRDFVNRFPTTDFSDDAQFMIGQSYFIRGDYPKAIMEFRRVLDRYPAGDKVPEAMYKLALSYLEIEDAETARQYFQILVDRYPGSVEAKRAQDMLETMR
jgi:tol-pal system protein YbgF